MPMAMIFETSVLINIIRYGAKLCWDKLSLAESQCRMVILFPLLTVFSPARITGQNIGMESGQVVTQLLADSAAAFT